MKLFGLLFLFSLISSIVCAQNLDASEHHIYKRKNGTLYLSKKGVLLDSICIIDYNRNKIFVTKKGTFITVKSGYEGIDDFSSGHYCIEEYVVADDKFCNKNWIKLFYGDCKRNKVRVRLSKQGVEWICRTGLLSRNKGIITEEMMEEYDRVILKRKPYSIKHFDCVPK